MNRQTSKLHLTRADASTKDIVNEWLTAVTTFYRLYQELLIHKNKRAANPLPAGQHPAQSLTTLVLLMQSELEKLVVDMDQLNSFQRFTKKQEINKLMAHTQTLNQLIKHGQICLYWVSNPAS